MSNFGYDNVLLKWEITGTGRCVGSYSHFNSNIQILHKQDLYKAITITTIEPFASYNNA